MTTPRVSRTAPDADTEWSGAMTARIATAIRDLRGDMSAQRVSDKTAELGSRVTRAVIADLETGRRKFLPVHELIMIAAALGVTPATMLTWGDLPDGDVELFPGRTVSGFEAARWIGGTPLNPFEPTSVGLPTHQPSADLMRTSEDRDRFRLALVRTGIGNMGEVDPGLTPLLRDRLAGAVARIRALGGVIRGKGEGGDDG